MTRLELLRFISPQLREAPVHFSAAEIDAHLQKILSAEPQDPTAYAYVLTRHKIADRVRRDRARTGKGLRELQKRLEEENHAAAVKRWREHRDLVVKEVLMFQREEDPPGLDSLLARLRDEPEPHDQLSRDACYQRLSRAEAWMRAHSDVAATFYETYRWGRAPKL